MCMYIYIYIFFYIYSLSNIRKLIWNWRLGDKNIWISVTTGPTEFPWKNKMESRSSLTSSFVLRLVPHTSRESYAEALRVSGTELPHQHPKSTHTALRSCSPHLNTTWPRPAPQSEVLRPKRLRRGASATALSPAPATRAPQGSPAEGLCGEGVPKSQAPASPMLKLSFLNRTRSCPTGVSDTGQEDSCWTSTQNSQWHIQE